MQESWEDVEQRFLGGYFLGRDTGSIKLTGTSLEDTPGESRAQVPGIKAW